MRRGLMRRRDADVAVFLGRSDGIPTPGDVSRLTQNERRRADGFRTAILRGHFIAAHAARQRILSAILGHPPGELRFSEAPGGKPVLRPPHHWLRFNLSHSAPWFLLACSARHEIGVDIEVLAKQWPGPLASAAFSGAERQALEREADPSRQNLLLHTVWVRKEALLKGCGTGLRMDPRDVTVDADPSLGISYPNRAGRPIGAWRILGLPPVPGAAVALAVAGVPRRICCWRITEASA